MANTDTSLTLMTNTQLNTVRVSLSFFAATDKSDNATSAINLTFISFSTNIFPFNVFIGLKNGIRNGDKRRYGKRDSSEKRVGMRD